ncbi:MAG: hypothetical protein GEU80_15875 [Dehalococcoidia bacterium]|nr:hypothetical protein [Dehalococcoidia bacterium]
MTTADSAALTPGALDDLRVLDLTGRLGQYCGRLLASLGADVIRVEPPGGGVPRRAHPLADGLPEADASLDFWFHNLRKRSVVADLDTDDGRALVARLAAGADILLESETPGVMAARGLDYATLAKANPALIYASITPFGQTGPYARFAASDITLMAVGGQMWLCGYPDAPPARLAGQQAYMQAGLHASYATLIALRHRDLTSQGQHIDLSTQDCIATAMETAMQFWDLRRELRVRTGAERRSPGAGPYPCADGVVQWMAPATANGWANLCAWLREEGVEGDYDGPEWSEPTYRVAHLEEFDRWFIPWVMTKAKSELAAGARRHHLTIGPVRNVDEILADDHIEARGYWTAVESPDGRVRSRAPGVPLIMSETPLRAGGRAPCLGEHTEEVADEPPREPVARIAEDRRSNPEDALDGVRVVDFSWFGAGPMGTMVLADHGAEVIRIESEYRLDGLRRAGPKRDGETGPNHSGYYNNHNSSKLSVRLNMNTPGGRALVGRLIKTADVVIDNLNTGVMQKWGLGYEELRALKPDLIVVNMPMMGLTGPRKDEIGFGATLTGICGLNALTGFPNQMPVGVGTNFPDYSCNPYHAMSAVLAALHYRERTGLGQHIELSQVESTLQLLGPAFLEYTVTGQLPERQGNLDPLAAPHGAYRAAGPPTSAGEDDRWIAFGCFTDAHWQALTEEMGSPAWAAEERFATLEGRRAQQKHLDGLVGEWVRTQDAYELMQRLQGRGIPSGVVQDAGDTLDRDPQLRAREHFQLLHHPEAGEAWYDAPPVKLSRTPGRLHAPAPCLGQHNDYIFRDVLGLGDSEYDEYDRQGVFF